MKKKVFYGALTILAALALYIFFAAAPYARPAAPSSRENEITGRYLGEGAGTERVRLVESAEEGLPIRMQLLQKAEKTLDISYYAVHMGASTDTVLGGILEAADRGVQVRLLLDGMFAKLGRAYAQALGGHPNIELKYYNVLDLGKPQAINARLHDKYILADGNYLLLGGTNLGDQYLSPEGYGGPVSYDREVLVCGDGDEREDSVFTSVRAYMDGIWDGPWVTEYSGASGRKGDEKGASLRSAARDYYAANGEMEDLEASALPAARVAFLSGDTTPGPKAPDLGAVLGRLALEADHSVVMQSPYVILDEQILSFLEALGEKNINCEILTNSIASSPNPTARSVYAMDRKTIAAQGFRLLEYQGPGSIHAKTYVIDDRLVLLGSFNMDPRSAYIDTELMLAIDSPELAQAVLEAQGRYRAQALEVLPDGSYGEDGAVEPRPVGLLKRTVTALLSPLARAFRYLV